MTLVIAHRGASAAERENTVAAFERAVELGADGVELDVRRTADDRLVVHHDATLPDGRTIRSTPSARLPEHVPLLGDAIDACPGLFVNIEIKNDPRDADFDPTEWVALRVIAELARRSDPEARWLVSSFRRETVDSVRRVAPRIRTALLTLSGDVDAADQAARAGHDAWHPWVEVLGEQALRYAHSLGLAVNTWTCNDPVRLRQLMKWGVDGICTDVPDVALACRLGS